MNCEYLVKKDNCKFKAKLEYLNKNYCTRHYNLLIKQNENKDIKKESKNKNKNSSKKNNKMNINLESILIENNILFDSIELLNSGTFNIVYLIKYQENKYIIKYQNLKDNKNLLYYEYLLSFNHFNNKLYFPELIYFNDKTYFVKKDEYALLCQEFLYFTLNEKKNIYNFTLLDILNIGIQLINIIEYIHSKKFLYLDLKPDNIMFINQDELQIKIIDFNLCEKYITPYSDFYPNNKIKKRKGNDIFSSINLNSSHRGQRFDDIESILYIMLYLLNDNEFNNIINEKNINEIINYKENIFNNYISEYPFINNFINEINNNIIIEHKKPNYRKFKEILNIN